MKNFFSIVTGIVIAAVIAVGVGSIALHHWFAASATSSGPRSTTNQLATRNGNSTPASSNRAASSNTAVSNSTAASNSTPASSNTAASNSTPASHNTAATSTANDTSTKPPTTSAVQTSGSLTAAQQNSIASTLQTLQNDKANTPVDCSALVQAVYAQAGIKVPRTVSQQATVGARITSESQLQYGDIVFFDLSAKPNQATFDGIYVGNGKFVALMTHGISSSALNAGYWQGKFLYGQRG